MRILCVSAQKPDSTGSGVYLAETARAFVSAGHEVMVVAGLDVRDTPDLPEGVRLEAVRFNTSDLPFILPARLLPTTERTRPSLLPKATR